MATRPFEFDLFRLVIVEPDVFEFLGRAISGDEDISKIIAEGCAAAHDVESRGAKNQWKWSLRDYEAFDPNAFGGETSVTTARFARSLLEQMAPIVTDDTIIEGTSHAEPPAALPIRLIFYWKRHLVAVEHSSAIMNTHAWLDALHQILDKASAALSIRSLLRLEPVPEANQVLEAFFSFQRLTHLQVTLRLPNPEISRFARGLYDQMRDGGVREYVNHLKNGAGLSQVEGRLPHAVASLAQEGYKKGEVLMAGTRDGKRTRLKTGRYAARGQVDQVRDFVRGQATIAKTREARVALNAVLEEIERMHPAPPIEADKS